MTSSKQRRKQERVAALAAAAELANPTNNNDTMKQAGIFVAMLEAGFCLMEFLFGLVVIKSLFKNGFQMLLNCEPTELPHYALFISNLVSHTCILYWTLFRLSSGMGLTTQFLFSQMTRGPWVTKLGGSVIALHTTGFLLMAITQYMFDRWMFSFDNYYTDGILDPTKISEMLLLSPIREEFVFRAVMFCIFYRRIGDMSASSKIKSMIISSVIFGLVHLLNLSAHKYSYTYIAMQVTLGMLIGMMYAFRFVINKSISETLLLHITNNIFSSFLPLDVQFSFSDPILMAPLLQTIVVYSMLNYMMYKQVHDKLDDKPFDIVDNHFVDTDE